MRNQCFFDLTGQMPRGDRPEESSSWLFLPPQLYAPSHICPPALNIVFLTLNLWLPRSISLLFFSSWPTEAPLLTRPPGRHCLISLFCPSRPVHQDGVRHYSRALASPTSVSLQNMKSRTSRDFPEEGRLPPPIILDSLKLTSSLPF